MQINATNMFIINWLHYINYEDSHFNYFAYVANPLFINAASSF